jgi:replicative DNA helicase
MNDAKNIQHVHSLEAEQALLGLLLIKTSNMIILPNNFNSQMFYAKEHEVIFRAIKALYDNQQEIDTVIVIDFLRKKGYLLEAGGREYLEELSLSVLITADINAYAKIVHESYILRKLREESISLAETAYSYPELTIDQMISKYINNIENLRISKAEEVSLSKDMDSFISMLADNSFSNQFMKCGYSSLDHYNILNRGLPTVIAGRPGMGKSSFALNLSLKMASTGKSVVFFSLESSKTAIISKMLAIVSMVDSALFKQHNSTWVTENGFEKMLEGVDKIKKLETNLVIIDQGILTVQDARNAIKKINETRLKNNLGLIDVVVIDQFDKFSDDSQLLKHNGQTASSAKNCKDITAWAKQDNIAVVLLAQLNRNVDNRTNKVPMISELKQTGQLEQDAGSVLLLYREDYYHKHENDYKPNNIIEIHIAKSREGDTGKVDLFYDMKTQQITEIQKQYGDFQSKIAGDS